MNPGTTDDSRKVRGGDCVSAASRRTDRNLMRAMNCKLVLDHVLEQGTTSQAELIRLTGLSTGTIVSLVRELGRRGLLSEVGPGRSSGGRRPTLIGLNPSAAVVLACHVGSDAATVGVLDLRASLVERWELDLEPGRGPAFFLRALAGNLRRRIKKLGRRKIAGLGLSLHGPVDAARGTMLFSAHLGWRDVAFAPELGRALGIPVFAEAETRAIALAEQRWGAARGARDFVLVELDTGIGMVQVLDGKLNHGSHWLAGELGFSAWDPAVAGNRPRRLPTLERLASLDVICRMGGRSVSDPARRRTGHASRLDSRVRRLRAAAEAGQSRALASLDRAARLLGVAIANIINMLDPERVILTGRIASEDGLALADRIRKNVLRHMLATTDRCPRIEMANLGPDAALLGAARLAIDHFFSVENLTAR